MKYKIKFFLFLIFNLCFNSAFSQNSNLIFKHLSLNEGLSQNPIFSIKQDKLGFVWIGSRRGLIRYDGYEFKTFINNKLDEKNLKQLDINAIEEDINHNIWLATSNGLYLFERDSEKFIHIKIKGVKFVSSIKIYQNKLWVGTDKGLKIIDYSLRKFESEIKALNGIFIYSFLIDSHQNLWCGSQKGLININLNSKIKIAPAPSLINQLVKTPVKIVTIAEDNEHDIWFGTEDSGLFWYNQSKKTCEDFLHSYSNKNSIPSDFVRDILVDSDNKIWVGTRNGLSIFNKQTGNFDNYSHKSENKESLSHNTIWNIMKDASGSIWLTTYAGGINIYNPSSENFKNIGESIGSNKGLNQPLVNAILGDNQGGFWVGTDGGGLNYINKKENKFEYYSIQNPELKKTSNIIKHIIPGFDKEIWLGTLDGICIFNTESKKIRYLGLSTNIKSNTRINSLLRTKNGIWAATDADGLIFIDRAEKVKVYKHTKEIGSLSSDFTNTLYQDSADGIYIGTAAGLNHFNPLTDKFETFNTKSKDKKFNSNVIISIFKDHSGQMWLGTRSGLQSFNKNSGPNFCINESDGLANNLIQSITDDDNGNLWVSTNNGISKIMFGAKKGDFKIINYSSVDGLISNQWMPNAVYKNKKGEIYFGGVNGISFFDSNKIIANKHSVKVVFTDFMIHNKVVKVGSEKSPLQLPIELTKKIVLKYDQNFITIKFAVLNFVNVKKNNYAFKLEGLDKSEEWSYNKNQNSAIYTGLEPGKYTFKVKAATNDGVWDTEVTMMQITVLPPFWLTWWAYIIYFLALATLFYFIVRFFNRQAKLERDLYYEHLQFERQQELHQMKLNFFTNISHEIRTPLTLIAAPLEKLLVQTLDNLQVNNQLKMIQNNSKRLLKIVNELMDFRKTETGNLKLKISENFINDFIKNCFESFTQLAASKDIDFQLTILEQPVKLYFDYYQMEKVIFNLLSNSFKFTPNNGKIEILLSETNAMVQISIVDNGSGIPYEDQEKLFSNFYQGSKHNPKHIGTGIGLAFSKSIVELHNGIIAFESKPLIENNIAYTKFNVSLLKENLKLKALNDELLELSAETDHSIGLDVDDLDPISMLEVDENGVKKYKILVVEDNKEVQNFIVSSLSGNYFATSCNDGVEGYEEAVEEVPDLIITDVMMPNMDGTELCYKLKNDVRTSHIPIIMLTAQTSEKQQLTGLKNGADVYVVKPFSLQILLLNVKNLLKSKEVMQKKFSQQVLLEPRDVIITSNEGIFLSKLLDIIDNLMDDSDFGVVKLASEIGMSQPVLYRKIKALTDMSVADFIKSIRLKKAAKFLLQKQMNISDVAFAVGFNNRKHFSKEFRKQYGVSPTDYMAENCNKG